MIEAIGLDKLFVETALHEGADELGSDAEAPPVAREASKHRGARRITQNILISAQARVIT